MMSDCEKCWDTPCDCGFKGYVTVYPPSEEILQKQLRTMSLDRYKTIQKYLSAALREEILNTATPCKEWLGDFGICSSCGISAYDHPGAPTPSSRGCTKFKWFKSEMNMGRPFDRLTCETCRLPEKLHKETV